METIKIKYFTDIEPLQAIEQGDLIDLRAAEDVEMKAFDFKIIPLGVAMELPKGYKANVYPSIIIGVISTDLGTNAILGKSEYIVSEAD